MKVLKITDSSNVETLIPDNHIYAVQITNNLITQVIYNNAGTTATVTVAAFNGTNNKYEVGCLVPGNIFSAYVANYIVR